MGKKIEYMVSDVSNLIDNDVGFVEIVFWLFSEEERCKVEYGKVIVFLSNIKVLFAVRCYEF